MTRAAIEARLAMLRQELAEATATVHALGGAIQDCEFWLKTLHAQPPPAEETPTT